MFVGVFVGVFVGGMGVGVLVTVFVGGTGVFVGVQAAILTAPVALPKTGAWELWSVPETSISSMKKNCVAPQAGAVSLTLPVQVSVEVPFGPSVVTGVPAPDPWRQGTATGVPPGDGTVFVTWRPVTLKAGSRF